MPEASSQADREAETRKFFERAITTDSDASPLQIAELRAIAHVGLGDIDRAAAEFTAAMSAWTPADKYRSPLYKLLARRWPDGATVLRGKWQEIIARNPEAATPWG